MQFAADQVLVRQVERGAQLNAEHPGRGGLLERRGEHADRLVGAARPVAELADRDQRVRLDGPRARLPRDLAGPPRPVQRLAVVASHHQRDRVRRHRPRQVPGWRVVRRLVHRVPGYRERLGEPVPVLALQHEVRQPLPDAAEQAGVVVDDGTGQHGLAGEQGADPPQQVHRARHVAARRRGERGPQAQLAAAHRGQQLRVWHPVPERERLVVVLVRLGGRADPARLLRRGSTR